jgi:hypothetical protein
VDGFHRSIELDAIPSRNGESPDDAVNRFRTARGLGPDHPLLDTVLAGDAAAVTGRIGRYEAAGATDLMLGFADFPSTAMLEAFAAAVPLAPRSPDNQSA